RPCERSLSAQGQKALIFEWLKRVAHGEFIEGRQQVVFVLGNGCKSGLLLHGRADQRYFEWSLVRSTSKCWRRASCRNRINLNRSLECATFSGNEVSNCIHALAKSTSGLRSIFPVCER